MAHPLENKIVCPPDWGGYLGTETQNQSPSPSTLDLLFQMLQNHEQRVQHHARQSSARNIRVTLSSSSQRGHWASDSGSHNWAYMHRFKCMS